MAVRLSDDEVRACLTSAHTGILTTLRRDGWPVTLPVWFVLVDDRVFVRTPSKTRKVAHVRRDDRVSFCVESGERWAELQAVVITGRAVVVEDEETNRRVGAALDAKYASFRTPRKALPEATRKHYAVPVTTLRIEPTQAPLSWDNAKIRRPRA